jgi:hypothetical protein
MSAVSRRPANAPGPYDPASTTAVSIHTYGADVTRTGSIRRYDD